MQPQFDLPDEILLATSNAKKIREMERQISLLGIRLLTLSNFPTLEDVEETGETFIENAKLKAISRAQSTGKWAIGEDSGLCVASLGGSPGVYSARFAGSNATDRSNNELLLEKMKGVPLQERTAFYVSTIALSNPLGEILLRTYGECHGRIRLEPRGEGGFGYDPLFEVIEYHQTFAELGGAVKSAISHRGRSLRQFLRSLACHTTSHTNCAAKQ